MVTKLEKDKEKINKKLANLLELNLEGKINKEQYTEKFDSLNVELLKIENKIQSLLKETNRTESIKQRLNKFKILFKNIDIMPKFDKEVFECLIDKVVIGETLEDGTINPYTIRFICKNGTEINCKDKFTAMSDNNIQIILQPERNKPRGMRGSATTKARHVILDFDMVSEIITFEDKGKFGKEKHQNLGVKVKVVA